MEDTLSQRGRPDVNATVPKFLRCPDCSLPSLEVIDRIFADDGPLYITHCLRCGKLAHRPEAELASLPR